MMVAGMKMPFIGGQFCILGEFRELNFCGHVGPCFSVSFVYKRKCAFLFTHIFVNDSSAIENMTNENN